VIVSFCVVAYNEKDYLPNLFKDICSQTYPHFLIEVVLVDGMSSDGTRQLMEEFKENNKDFRNVIILDNPKRRSASGWNFAITATTGDVIIRIDAHASVPSNFVQKNVECIKSGEDISGGARPNIIDGDTPWKSTLLLAESSMFGSSIAPYRRNLSKTYVKSMFHATYKREVFEKVGGFNENLGRTEDNEIHYRMRKAGYKLCFNPDIVSYQHTRSSLKKMLRQKYLNGYWIGLTTGVCPGCLSLYHFVPFAFLIGIIITSLLAVFGLSQLGMLMWGTYWVGAILMAILSIGKENFNITSFALPVLFFLLHISYGVGTLLGLIKMPSWRKRNKYCEAVEKLKMDIRNKAPINTMEK